MWGDDVHAIKRLRRGAGDEAKVRFRREAELVERFRQEGAERELAIVPVVEIREREGALEIVMERLEANLGQIITRFRGDPRFAARVLAPVVNTLAHLSARQPPVHHRDIKPTNLFVRVKDAAVPELLVGDFGCAYVGGDDRLTSTHRAVGAWAYRAPEYSSGRVAEVSEKGDVYSLGKVLWTMVNGEPDEVFPESLWHIESFDLTRRFQPSSVMLHTTLLIAGAVRVNPGARPTLAQFASSLTGIYTSDSGAPVELSALELLKAEAQVELEHQERFAYDERFVRLISADLAEALRNLADRVPDSAMLRAWQTESARSPQTADALVQQVAEHQSDAAVVNVRFRGLWLNTRFHARTDQYPARFAARLYWDRDPNGGASFWVHGHASGLITLAAFHGEEAERRVYEQGCVEAFLFSASVRMFRERG